MNAQIPLFLQFGFAPRVRVCCIAPVVSKSVHLNFRFFVYIFLCLPIKFGSKKCSLSLIVLPSYELLLHFCLISLGLVYVPSLVLLFLFNLFSSCIKKKFVRALHNI